MTDEKPELLACAHCGAEMLVRARTSFHPQNGCWLAGYELSEDDYELWNRRTPAPVGDACRACAATPYQHDPGCRLTTPAPAASDVQAQAEEIAAEAFMRYYGVPFSEKRGNPIVEREFASMVSTYLAILRRSSPASIDRDTTMDLRYWIRSCAFRECIGHERTGDREDCFRFLKSKAEQASSRSIPASKGGDVPRPQSAPLGTCDWGGCDHQAVTWRPWHDGTRGVWLPVCADHGHVDGQWREYDGDPDTLPQEFFLAVVMSPDEYGEPAPSAPILLWMDPTNGNLMFGNGQRCNFNDGEITHWKPFTDRSSPHGTKFIADELAKEMT